ncbi:MAG TPA: hypothetical protein DCS63_10860 [Elusimicrobia bacterium]|nr:hypothetical protein [Elusimicrobiota bacterium]
MHFLKMTCKLHSRKHKLIALSAFILAQSLFCGCQPLSSGSDVWGVIFTSLPSHVSAENIEDPAVAYIFRQTHEPLFRQEDGENFRSKVLLNWARNIKYTEYKFWPDSDLRFNDKIGFSAGYLYSFAEKITRKYGAPFEASLEKDHVVVKFRTSQPGYLLFLTQYKNAPSVINGPTEDGLGEFAVKNISKARIGLERKRSVRNGYNRIVLSQYGGPTDPNLQSRLIADFNKISSFQWPSWIKTEYTGFDNIELRSVGLAINHPDAQVRNTLYNCIDVDEFRRAAIPARKDFYDIQTVLPVGVPGASGGRPVQACIVPKRIRGMAIVLANPRSDNQKELATFSDKFNKNTGLHLVIKQYQPKEMNPMLFDRNYARPYNLVIVVAENFNREQDDFFDSYVGEDRAINDVPASIRKNFSLMRGEGFPGKKRIMAEKLAEQLSSAGLALPLYQTIVKLYYPKRIKNLSVGRGFIENPDVADLRW